MVDNNCVAEEVPRGKSRTMVDHFLNKLDTMMAKTVLVGSLGSREPPIIYSACLYLEICAGYDEITKY